MIIDTTNLKHLNEVPANLRVARDANGTGIAYRNFIPAAHMPFATSTRFLKAGFYLLTDEAAAAIALGHVDTAIAYVVADRNDLQARIDAGADNYGSNPERYIDLMNAKIAAFNKAKAKYAKMCTTTPDSKEETMPAKTATESVAARRLRLRNAAKTSQAKLATKRTSAAKPKGKSTPPKQTGEARAAIQAENARLTKAIVAGLKAEKTLSELAAELDRPVGKLAMLKMIHEVTPAQEIKGTEAAMAKAIVEARDKKNQSWGQITARTRTADGLPLAESTVKGIYAETTGTDTLGLRVGKGGRLPSDPKAAAKVARPAPKAKAAPAAKAAPKGKPTASRTRSARTSRRAGGVQTVK